MTVSYNLAVSSVGSFTFLKLLGRWKGSIFKSVYWELLGWLIAYYIIYVIYRFALTVQQQKDFERVVTHLDSRLVYIPLTFMLGFFVTIVIDRWRSILVNISYIEHCAITVSSLIRGHTEEARLIRRNIIRYLVLSQVMLFRDISMRVRRRFPNMESLIDAGFLFQDELDEIVGYKFDYNKYWMPINWANSLICHATFPEEGRLSRRYIDSAPTMNQILNTIKEFRLSLDMMCKFDWVPIPIAYPQVVFLAVRVYFVICLFSRQFMLHNEMHRQQAYLAFPLMTILEFLFFVGWMKVAEALLNPLGEDDDDLECNWLIDKNIATGMAIVDPHHDRAPKLRMDIFADPEFKPIYSADSAPPDINNGSAANVELVGCNEKVTMLPMDFGEEQRKTSENTLRRKITHAFIAKPRSHSIQPLDLPRTENHKQSGESSVPRSPIHLTPLSEEESSSDEERKRKQRDNHRV